MSYSGIQTEQTAAVFFEKTSVCDAAAHFHCCTEIVIVESGELTATVSGQKRTLSRGDVCFSDGLTVHAYGNARELSAYLLRFDKTYFARFEADFPEMTFPTFFRFENFEMLEMLYECVSDSSAKGIAFAGTVNLLAAEFLKTVSPVARKNRTRDELICNILEYIENNLNSDINLTVLSEKFGYSREYISRTFSRLVGSLPRYVNRLRAQKVKSLLEAGDRNITELASECGFDSSSTFYRVYREVFGRPPLYTPSSLR